MELKIESTAEEQKAVLDAISQLNDLRNVKYMSQAMIAATAGIKVTKVRVVLMDLIAAKKITQYAATTNPARQRFYYVINQDPGDANT